ncbi:hypothetical protein HUG15_07075 [Salicibibacter cibarius]|uniref:Uncharacterized protein n=1 Tax=Salicibibacter cibarius TaxID=2743000 RepID=A0A7T6Z2A4_9BACI|nr:hypothetical protein [Salicibibacter cibarius]QQK75372.1 hypothetical protein HUG15_07075 [Salicibibacter cibarius]
MNAVKYSPFLTAIIIILSLTYTSTISAAEAIDDAEGGAGWVPTAALLLIMIGALVFFISRRNK